MQLRMDVISSVNQWAAKGGELALSYRPDQTLPVALMRPASANDIKAYAEEIEIAFESTDSPYWEDISILRHQMTGASGASQLAVPGNAPSCVNAAVYVLEFTSEITLTAGKTSIRLQNLSLPPGAYVTFTHDKSGLLSILYGETSLYPYLADESGDALMSEGGVTDISFETDGDIEITFSSQGRWI